MKVLILPNIKKSFHLKYFINLYYVVRSLILRGPLASLRLVSKESRYEKQFNIQTAEFIKSSSSQYFHYQGASYHVLFRLFESLDPLTKEFHFIDIGSGKGRAVFVAEYYGFNNLVGIELNADLVKDAYLNLKTYALKREQSQINFLSINALDYEYKNEATVYFLFNPFNASVLKKVLEKISASTVSETWFIYMNPLYASVFSEAGIRQEKVIRSGFYTEAIIYKIKPAP